MHAHEQFQLAAWVAVNARRLVRSRVRFSDHALEVYWTASKCRQEAWARALKALSALAPQGQSPGGEFASEPCEHVLDEVLLSEVLSRVWAAVCLGADRRRGGQEAGPLATSVLSGHLEARHRVLSLMVYGAGLGVERAVALNRRRLRCEWWTDMLLALFADPRDMGRCAFEPRRVLQWAQATRREEPLAYASTNQSLALSACTVTSRSGPALITANGELNRRIAASILGCFPPTLFDSVGVTITPLHHSLLEGPADTQGQVHLATPRNRFPGDSPRWRLDRRGGHEP